ncbi:ABC transporter substrate-binding protein [Streptomyces sp. NBC_00102]|uniref:ABC transporter substrate-binding protein n=1 Tax=Streptomyces sp. NBC_00102 TaxID=2975652 RepID=UPI00224F621E|nr:ABC transporter substrate-binding protein [Streptomyces sp. NBC_00102]MCX5397540.1 ABC transporter substrate-binding protein [Streptomyces sp. NBC_00102]
MNTRIRTGALVGIASALLLATACSADVTAPIPVEGKLGTAKIQGKPRTVVALDSASADIALSLGFKPTAMPAADEGVPGGITPWTRTALSGKQPHLLRADGDLVTQVASYKPDVILAVRDRTLDPVYAKLSAIAPVVHYVKGPDADPWQTSTRIIAKALGVKDQGEQLINAAEQTALDVRAAFPAIVGTRFNLLVSPMPSGVGAVRSREDTSTRVLRKLGLKLDELTALLPGSSNPARAYLDYADVGQADADVLFATGTPEALSTLEKTPAFRKMPAVTDGRYIPLDPALAQAIEEPTPHSVEWAVEKLAPKIGAAALAARG